MKMVKKIDELSESDKRNLYRRAVGMYENQGISQDTIVNIIFNDLKKYYLIDRVTVRDYVYKSLYHYVMTLKKLESKNA